MVMLSKFEKPQIDQLLELKMTLKEKRDHNRLEIEELKEMAKVEQNRLNHSMILNSIIAGEELVRKQTTQLNCLSYESIGRKFGVDAAVIVRYERSSQKGTNRVFNRERG